MTFKDFQGAYEPCIFLNPKKKQLPDPSLRVFTLCFHSFMYFRHVVVVVRLLLSTTLPVFLGVIIPVIESFVHPLETAAEIKSTALIFLIQDLP